MVLVHVGYLVLPVFGSVRNRGIARSRGAGAGGAGGTLRPLEGPRVGGGRPPSRELGDEHARLGGERGVVPRSLPPSFPFQPRFGVSAAADAVAPQPPPIHIPFLRFLAPCV